MRSDRLWNEIHEHMKLEHPSDAFTDQVMDAIAAAHVQQAHSASPAYQGQGNRRLTQGAVHAELMNALLASAATFLFIATGLWSDIISLQGGQFGFAVRETVANTLYRGIDILTEAIHRL
jgi:hypothetical protein